MELELGVMERISPETKREIIINSAKQYLGAPYKNRGGESWGNDPYFEFTCSSFIKFIFKKTLNKELSSISYLQAKCGILVSDGLKTADLLFFEGNHRTNHCVEISGKNLWIGHVGIYTGDFKIIHCTRKNGVIIDDLDTLPKPVLIKRLIF